MEGVISSLDGQLLDPKQPEAGEMETPVVQGNMQSSLMKLGRDI